MKSLHIINIVLLFSTVLAAQEPLSASGDNYFFLGLTLPITKVRDQAHSPQIYQGLTPTIMTKLGVISSHDLRFPMLFRH
jgi:hypothetical protein